MNGIERHTNRRLHEEHMAAGELLARFEAALLGLREQPPAVDQQWSDIATTVAAAVAGEIDAHFDFEERALFPRLQASGDGEIADLLAAEHVVIREVAGELCQRLSESQRARLTADQWQRLKALGLEYAERMAAHIQKEEMALLPALEIVLDEDDDAALVLEYAG